MLANIPPHPPLLRGGMSDYQLSFMKNTRLIISILISGFFLLVDQLLKYFARANPEYTYYLWKNWLGWEYYANPGIAFSLPVPNWLIVIITPLILLGLIMWFTKTYKQKSISYKLLAISLIVVGAVSNYIDRILFGVTIDYLRILTGVINLADVMIAGGVVLLLLKNNKRNL